MKTTLKSLSYLLLDMVNGGLPTDDSKINYRVAKAYIQTAIAKGLRNGWFEAKNNTDEHYTGDTVSKTVDVEFSSEHQAYFIPTLGESVSLEGMRAYNISDVELNSSWTDTYIPITLAERFSQKFLKPIPCVTQYYKMGDNLYFKGNSFWDGRKTKVNLTQSNVIPSNDDDSVPSWVGTTALNEAYRLAFAELNVISDRINDGVPLQ